MDQIKQTTENCLQSNDVAVATDVKILITLRAESRTQSRCLFTNKQIQIISASTTYSGLMHSSFLRPTLRVLPTHFICPEHNFSYHSYLWNLHHANFFLHMLNCKRNVNCKGNINRQCFITFRGHAMKIVWTVSVFSTVFFFSWILTVSNEVLCRKRQTIYSPPPGVS